MVLTILLCLVVFAVAAYYFLHNSDQKWRQLSRIPGPHIWPIIGNLHILDQSAPWNKTYYMARQYGPVMRLQMGILPVVVLNSYEAIYNGLITQGKKMLTRPPIPRAGTAVPNFRDVIVTPSNDQWKTLRRAFLHSFKYYGSGKSHLEPIILQTLQGFLGKLNNTEQIAIDPRPLIAKYFAEVIFILDFGKKPEQEGWYDLIESFDENAAKHLNVFGGGVELDVFPWYSKLGLGKGVLTILEKIAENGRILWDTHGRTSEANNNNVAFSYEEGRIHESSFAATLKSIILANQEAGFVEQHASGTIGDTFIGGVSTSTSAIYFFFNILLHYPEVQDRLHEEIDEILGSNGEAMITTDLKDEMPYLQATLYELLRYTTVVPLGFIHMTQEDVVIEGHFIPKDVPILTNLWHLHHDDHWDEPFLFKPERFLDEAGRFVSAEHPNRKHLMPFGAGPRVCAGKILAINRYFITMGNLMRHFTVLPDPDRGLQSCDPRDGKPGLILHGKNYTAKFIPRQTIDQFLS